MKVKIVFTFICICSLFVSVLVKAFYVQVVNRNKLIEYSESQFFRKVKRYPKRGNILDRNGNPLAINIRTFGVFAIPKNMKNKYETAKKLSLAIPSVNFSRTLKRFRNRDKYTWLIRKIELTEDQIEKVKKIEGIYLEEQGSRFYPNHELGGQILGFVGVDNIGLEGVEYYFNEKLKGKPEEIRYYRDAKGRPVKYESHHLQTQADELYLSIDKDIQAALEKHLKEGVIAAQAESGGAAVMDSETGEIWAIANYPSFDPNSIKSIDAQHRKLSFVTDPFEPGSVFKLFTVASALEHNIVNSSTNYYCEKGKLVIGNHTINEAEGNKKFEWLSVKDIVKYSSNIGTSKIAFDLTFSKLKESLEKFRIGQKTGIEIPGESRGIFSYKDNVNQLTLSNVSFGQGVATTGIQILSAYAAIANGGNYVVPTLIRRESKDEIDKERIISKDNSKVLEEMLIYAVEEGTGQNAMIPHFVIAGKTSTAQRVSPQGGYQGYVPGFVGYPVNVRKRFVVYVYVDNPKGEYYGNQVAAPIFQKITQNILYKNKEFNQIADLDNSRNNRIINDIKISTSSTKKINKDTVPSFVGLDKRTALELAQDLGIEIESMGFGLVFSQYPSEGSVLDKGKTIKLRFRPPKYE